MLTATSYAALLTEADPAEQWLAIVDVAKMFGRTVQTVQNWMKDEDVQFPKPKFILGRRYFRASDIEKWKLRFSDQLARRHAKAA